MIKVISYCPKCQAELKHAKGIIEGKVLARCEVCNHFALEGDHRWFSGPEENVMSALRDRIRELEAEHEMLWGEATDIRWSGL